MRTKKQKEVDEFIVQAQQGDLGLSEQEIDQIRAEASSVDDDEGGYLASSRSIPVRPTPVSQLRSFLYEYALSNEYIYQVGKKDAQPALGGSFFRLGRQYLKFPASVQTVYFTSDNANKNYQGLRVDGYACWRVDPEKPEVAARCLDFSDQTFPMSNTNRLLRTICTEAIRHIIANITIDDALTKKDDIGRQLKEQLGRVERTWGILFDQVGIERVTILSNSVFEDLQQQTRDSLRLSASESRMGTDLAIEKKQAAHTEEIGLLQAETLRKERIRKAQTETEIHQVELEETSNREAEDRKAAEARLRAEAEALERAAVAEAEQEKRQTVRQTELEAQKVAEEQKLLASRAAMEAEAEIQAIQERARLAQARAAAEKEKAELEYAKAIRDIQVQAEQARTEQDLEAARLAMQQAAELERGAELRQHELEGERERSLAAHEAQLKALDRARIEEELKNLVSDNRIRADLVKGLPQMMAGPKVDRYTVLAGAGEAPVAQALAQIAAVLEQSGLRGILSGEGTE